MRLSVECAFPHLGKRGAGSRKSAFCTLGLTEKRTLAAPPGRTSPKDALWRFWSSQSASFRDVKPQNALFRRVRFSSPGQTRRRLTEKRILAGRLTEKRTLRAGPHGKAHSAYDRALDVTEWHSRALQARRQASCPHPPPPRASRPSSALPCDLRTHQCPPARSAARTRAPQPRPTYARKETDHEGIRATA